MKLVGGVIGQSISTTRIPTIGVGNWGKTWKNHLLVHNRSGHYGGVCKTTCFHRLVRSLILLSSKCIWRCFYHLLSEPVSFYPCTCLFVGFNITIHCRVMSDELTRSLSREKPQHTLSSLLIRAMLLWIPIMLIISWWTMVSALGDGLVKGKGEEGGGDKRLLLLGLASFRIGWTYIYRVLGKRWQLKVRILCIGFCKLSIFSYAIFIVSLYNTIS